MGAEKGTGSHGPLRANMYVKVSARFDYQPDVCKDYKETGGTAKRGHGDVGVGEKLFCLFPFFCKRWHVQGNQIDME